FTPSDAIDMNNPKDWAYQLALLDNSKTKIVFTKEQLLEFLTHVGVTVDTNFVKIQRLPRYAIFGKMTGEHTDTPEGQAPIKPDQPATNQGGSWAKDFKPSRRVRDAPGGVASIFFREDEEDDTYTVPKTQGAVAEPVSGSSQAANESKPEASVNTGKAQAKPRRSQSSSLGLDMFESEDVQFKPTRREVKTIFMM
ncbi:hypothetical protein FRB99_006386, partial [Tulasnella sp. 403]